MLIVLYFIMLYTASAYYSLCITHSIDLYNFYRLKQPHSRIKHLIAPSCSG